MLLALGQIGGALFEGGFSLGEAVLGGLKLDPACFERGFLRFPVRDRLLLGFRLGPFERPLGLAQNAF